VKRGFADAPSNLKGKEKIANPGGTIQVSLEICYYFVLLRAFSAPSNITN
jgi:hypothetical protein